MNIKSLVFDQDTVNIFSQAIVTEEWFKSFSFPKEYNKRIKRVLIENEILFFLSPNASANSKLLVIDIDNSGLFSGLEDNDKSLAFDRIIAITLNRFGLSISPGKSWGKYVQDNILSVYATRRSSKSSKRVYFDTSPLDEKNHIFAFKLTSDNSSHFCSSQNEELFLKSLLSLEYAINEDWQDCSEDPKPEKGFGFELTESLSSRYGMSFTLRQWYDSKLTSEQRSFVDKSYDEPVRLKGAAGTGKTLALAVKILNDAYYFEENKKLKRLIFVTHSHATSQLVLDLILSMDEKGLWGRFIYVHIELVSLYDLAQKLLNYNLKKIQPLSTDGKEGRQLQFDIATDVINEKLEEYPFRTQVNRECSSYFKDFLLDKERRREFTFEILNEFACILDAENIYLGSASAEKYLNDTREIWQMNLENKEDRIALLQLHASYRRYLKALDVLSMDQMIADLNLYLMSHEWNHICQDSGYDAIFIDELHYFTRPERMIFHELYRRTSDSAKIPLFMAYDIKQSTDDAFLYSIKSDNASTLVKSTMVGSTKLVELKKVFRYTPEIANFLNDVDGSFPALDLPAEWQKLSLTTDNKNYLKPELTVFDSNKSLVDAVFKEANREAKKDIRKTVAILCINDELFAKYLTLGRIKGQFEAISSRDDVIRINRLKGKCIFSMPDYVAGLQFDTVFIIHLDKNEVDEDNPHCGLYRRFVSRVYLGASRAKTVLKVSSSKERQGYSSILNGAICNGSLVVE